MIIPGEVISFITFPGVIIHEMSHRFLCDISNVPVYAVDYFSLDDTVAGRVIHQRTQSFIAAFFIGIAPLIVNSLICMIILFPHGTVAFYGTDFMCDSSLLLNGLIGGIVKWLGYSIGFQAIPSNQDIAGLEELVHSELMKTSVTVFRAIIYIFNADYVGAWLRIGYVYGISQILPALILG